MRQFTSKVVEILYWVSTVATALLSVIAKVDPATLQGHYDPLLPLFIWLKARTWFLLITSISAAFFAVVRKRIEAPWVRKAVKHILDEMREHAFNCVPHAPNYHNRVTLFKRTRGICWKALFAGRMPFGGWLVPFARSGHMTQKISVCFWAPDDADKAEGIAGQTFAQDVILPIEDLPDVSGVNVSEADLRRYAERTFVNAEWLRNEKSTARALIGIPVKVKGEPWGVIVVDSRSTRIPNRESVIQSYELIAKVLGELLDRSET